MARSSQASHFVAAGLVWISLTASDACVSTAVAKQPAVKPAAGDNARSGTTRPDPMTMEVFLDRLMMAESGGRHNARNPRSTATGPYQFIVATFLAVVRRHFPDETANLTSAQILARRTDVKFSRKAAAAYTRDNAAYLAAAGQRPTFPHLRLAFLLGPAGAVKVLSAQPGTRLTRLLSRAVLRANPFMARLTAGGLIARAARDISSDPKTTAGIAPGKVGRRAGRTPKIRVRCNLARASCRRWLALKKRRLSVKARRARLGSRQKAN